jgi:hypothetical protein
MTTGLGGDESLGDKRKKCREEVASLFGKSKGGSCKKQMKTSVNYWKHKFVCLPYTDQTTIIISDHEKDVLLKAGLGEKEVEFCDINIGAEEFKNLLYEAFPGLEHGGGFQLLRCTPNSRILEVLSPSTLSSPMALKSRVRNSRTYIRPLQRNLDTTAILDLPEGPQEHCIKCYKLFTFENLIEHVKYCTGSVAADGGEDFEGDCSDNWDDKNVDETSSSDDEILKSVLEESLRTYNENSATTSIDEIAQLKSCIEEERIMTIEIRREFVLIDALKEARKAKFDVKKRLDVRFVGERAIDLGGPKQEFFNLLSSDACHMFFKGKDNYKFFMNNVTSVQNNDFFYLGMFCVLSISYGGIGMPFFSKEVFEYFSRGACYAFGVSVENIPDTFLRYTIEKLNEVQLEEELGMIFSTDEALNLLSATGYRKSISSLKLEDIKDVKTELLDFSPSF